MGWLGSILGSGLGAVGGAFMGKPSQGAQIGHDFGNNFLPFRSGGIMLQPHERYKHLLTGGKVKAKRKKFQK